MKNTPMLYSAPMVRALLAGTKTQTRRPCKPAPIADDRFVGGHYLPGKRKGDPDVAVKAPYIGVVYCPYGAVGDSIWVRETFWAWGRWETRFSTTKRRDEWHFVDMTLDCDKTYRYDADGFEGDGQRGYRAGKTPAWFRRPGIFMPRAACRIELDITGVRVEPLQDISEADAIAEGIERAYDEWRDYRTDPAVNHPTAATPVESYRTLWAAINGPDSWEQNTWVWVVEFRRSRS